MALRQCRRINPRLSAPICLRPSRRLGCGSSYFLLQAARSLLPALTCHLVRLLPHSGFLPHPKRFESFLDPSRVAEQGLICSVFAGTIVHRTCTVVYKVGGLHHHKIIHPSRRRCHGMNTPRPVRRPGFLSCLLSVLIGGLSFSDSRLPAPGSKLPYRASFARSKPPPILHRPLVTPLGRFPRTPLRGAHACIDPRQRVRRPVFHHRLVSLVWLFKFPAPSFIRCLCLHKPNQRARRRALHGDFTHQRAPFAPCRLQPPGRACVV